MPGRQLAMPVRAEATLLALLLASKSVSATRFARLQKKKWAYFATCFYQPEEFDLFGFMLTTDGVEVLWQPTGSLRRLTVS